MPGIPRRLAEQALRCFSEPKRQAMGEELAKLPEAGFIRDIKHPDWLANLVMVPKKDKSRRLFIDFKDLNKLAQRIPSPSPASIKSSTPLQDTIHCVFSMHTLVTTKSRWRSLTKPQRHLSHHMAPSVSTQCLLGSKTPAQHISA